MCDIRSRVAHLVSEARLAASLTQSELAERTSTSPAAIARLEQGESNPTIETLDRCAAALGYALRIELVAVEKLDPVVEAYKKDVDRTLLRENLRKSVNERVRSLGEWQESMQAVQSTTAKARRTI